MYILVIVLISIYILRTLLFSTGVILELKRLKKLNKVPVANLPFVSVVIPARNEANLIKNCLLSLQRNNYPIDKYEIIVVNDRSTDNTGEILDALKSKISNLVVIHNDNQKAIKNLQGKPGALQLGINHCKGEIILMTDADCIINEKWIYENTVCYTNPNLGMTAAYTDVLNDDFFSSLQSVEWLFLHTMAVGGIGLDVPLSCFGNNISLSKEKFEEIGGYEALKFSVTEDLAMLQFMHQKGYGIRHLSNIESAIRTIPNATFKEYLNQHHRWVMGALSLGFKAFLFVLSTVAIWSAIIIPLFTGDYILSFIALAARLLCDFIIIFPSMLRMKRMNLLLYLLPAFLFMMLIELIAPLLTLKKDVKWKNQIFYDAGK